MMTEPKRWWFAIPLPAALMLSFAIWETRMWIGSGGFDDVLECAGPIAAIGFFGFPIGLPGVFWLPQDVLNQQFWWFVIGGYLIYLALSIAGTLRPARRILLILGVLLILNMIGCQMEHTVDSMPFGP